MAGLGCGNEWGYSQLMLLRTQLGPVPFNISVNGLNEGTKCSLANSQMTPVWVAVLICMRVGKLCRGISTGEVNQEQFDEFKLKCWILHVGQNNCRQCYSLGRQ